MLSTIADGRHRRLYRSDSAEIVSGCGRFLHCTNRSTERAAKRAGGENEYALGTETAKSVLTTARPTAAPCFTGGRHTLWGIACRGSGPQSRTVAVFRIGAGLGMCNLRKHEGGYGVTCRDRDCCGWRGERERQTVQLAAAASSETKETTGPGEPRTVCPSSDGQGDADCCGLDGASREVDWEQDGPEDAASDQDQEKSEGTGDGAPNERTAGEGAAIGKGDPCGSKLFINVLSPSYSVRIIARRILRRLTDTAGCCGPCSGRTADASDTAPARCTRPVGPPAPT